MACGCKRVGVGARVAVVCAECGVWVRESSLRRGVDYVWREETNRRSGRDRAARRSDPSGTPPYRRAGARGRGAGAMASRVASGGSMPAPRRDVRKRENKECTEVSSSFLFHFILLFVFLLLLFVLILVLFVFILLPFVFLLLPLFQLSNVFGVLLNFLFRVSRIRTTEKENVSFFSPKVITVFGEFSYLSDGIGNFATILTHKNVTAVRIIFFGKHAATCLTAPSSNETERVFSSFSLMTLDALITFVSCHSGMLRASGLRIQVQLEARALYREFLRNSSRKCHDSAGNPSNGNDPPAVEKWKL
ncbi:Protein of unknown function [Gryllus bimaculatus]|nr:Protein of unknown function [Gryllus bimaculatus]